MSTLCNTDAISCRPVLTAIHNIVQPWIDNARTHQQLPSKYCRCVAVQQISDGMAQFPPPIRNPEVKFTKVRMHQKSRSILVLSYYIAGHNSWLHDSFT